MSDPVTLPALMEPLENAKLAKLAGEIVSNINNLPAILKTYGLSDEQFAVIEQNPYFKMVFEASTIEWQAADNAQRRIAIKSAAIIEDALPQLGAMLTKEGQTAAGAAELGKLFTKWAKIEGSDGEIAPGEKFSITINLGDDKKLTFEKDITPTPPLIEEKPNEPA